MAAQLELAQRPFIELQIEALVEENRIKPKRVLKFIDDLETKIVSLKGPQNAEELNERFLRLPIIGRPNSLNDDYPKKFKFLAPDRVDVVGGFRTFTAMKRTNYVDLAICMPTKCLKDKDIKNQRYHQKRALYLSYLAQELNSSACESLIQKLEFKYHQGDFLKPVLVITPKDLKLRESTSFQLFVYPPSDVMKLSLLKPDRGNIAPKWFFKDHPRDQQIETEALQDFLNGDSDAGATPFYNSSILSDLEMVPNSDILFEQIGTQISITEALILVKIWLYQRELHNHFSFIMSMFVAYLQTQQVVHQNMSPYQIFKLIISSVASSDWSNEGLCYYEDSTEKISLFKEFFPIIFLSPSGNLNLCYNITSDLYARLKHEAQISQVVLNSNQPDTFDLLLLKKLDFINKFDVVVHLPKCTKKLHMDLDRLKRFMDHGVLTPHVYSENIIASLQRALTDRTILIQQSPHHLLSDKRWNLRSIPYDPTNEDGSFTFGLLLDPEKSIRITDVGPDAQSPDAEGFRKFWEPKSQLRLQNGIISETVVWHVNNFSQRRAIIRYILTHALKRLNISNIVVHYTMLESFINLQNVSFHWKDGSHQEKPPTNGDAQKRKRENNDKIAIGIGEDMFQRVLNAYNEFNKIVRGVENMKHDITTIQPISPHLRGSAVFPPLPVSLQQRNSCLKKQRGVTLFPENFNQAGKILHIEPVEIMLTLDSTGKWPSDPEALEAAKLEYLIQLSEALKEKEYTVKFAQDYLDVLHGQFVFRLRVKCPKQLTVAFPNKLDGQRRRLDLDILPRVHSALDQLYRERPAFGLTCRLVKRWVACHLMTDHISDMALDLIVAHLFLHPQPYNEPASSSCGFKRFLKLMAQFEWDHAPLIVNFDEQLKLDEISKLQESLINERSKFPAMVISTPYDNKNCISPWTRQNPTGDQLRLLRRICSKALKYYISEILLKYEVTDQCKALFRPNFKLFKLLIKLHPHNVQNFFMSIQAPQGFRLTGQEPSGSTASALKVMPIVGLNIVERYVELLRQKFDRVATFFYDRYGQRVIGVMLKPGHEEMSDEGLNELIINFKQLGSKLVESITRVKHDDDNSNNNNHANNGK